MTRNDLVGVAQRLREYSRNPHQINPVSETFHKLITEAADALSATAAERDTLRTEVDLRERQRLVLCEDKDRLIDMCKERDSQIADLKARLLEAERGNEELVRLRADTRVLRIALDRIAERTEAFASDDACMLQDSAAAISMIARNARETTADAKEPSQ